MKKHILFIIDGLPGGGAENVTLTLAKGMTERGYHVTLLSLHKRLDYEIPIAVNYLVDHDECWSLLRKVCELGRRAAALDRLLPDLFQEYGHPSLVISNLHKTDRIVVHSKILQACNLWFCIHGMFSLSYLSNKIGFSLWLKKLKLKQVYKNRQLITVSGAVGTDLTQDVGIMPKIIKTIYNPFNIKEISHRAAQDNPFAKEDYIAHIGRFHKVKRHDRLLDAFSCVALPGKLVLVGQGEASVTQMIKDRIVSLNLQKKVIIVGFTKNPLPIIKGAKLVALSSDSEGLPSVLIEALICHTPIVSTLCPGGIREIMTGELAPFLAELNSKSLAEKMQKAWHYPPVINAKMYQRFSYETILNEYLSLQKIDLT